MTSKHETAKAEQQYRTEQRNCGNCALRRSEFGLSKWMCDRNKEDVAEGLTEPYPLETYGSEKKQRCSIGGFAVKKTATCDRWIPLSA
jgi:hypothetical protein